MDEKKYSIKVDHKNKLIWYKHKGPIKPEDIGVVWDELLQIEEFTMGKYNLLSDYSKGKFIGTTEDVEMICNILYSIKDILFGKKQALIQDTPMDTALSLLFEGKVNEQVGFIVRVFSTEKAAFRWLTE